MATMVPLKIGMMVKPLPVLVLFLSVTSGQLHFNEKSDSVADVISSFKYAVTELTRQVEDLKQFQKHQMKTVENLQVAFNSVQIENKQLNQRVAFLESRLTADFDQSNEDLQNKDSASNPNDDGPKPNVTTVHSDILTKLSPEITTRLLTGRKRVSRSRMTRVPGTNQNPVAFYAYLSHNVPDPRANFIVKNDHVVTNLAQGYNPTSGIFTCPKAGVYVFSWSVGIGTNGQIYSELAKNGVAAGYLWTGEHDWAETSASTVILELTEGDVIAIKVETTGKTNPALWSLRTSFSGYLIPY